MLDHSYIIAVYSDNVKPDPSIEATIRLAIDLRRAYDVNFFFESIASRDVPKLHSFRPFTSMKTRQSLSSAIISISPKGLL